MTADPADHILALDALAEAAVDRLALPADRAGRAWVLAQIEEFAAMMASRAECEAWLRRYEAARAGRDTLGQWRAPPSHNSVK